MAHPTSAAASVTPKQRRHEPPPPLARWLEAAARLGYTVKGAIYLLLGGSAVAAATGMGQRTQGTRGILRVLFAAPFGGLLLAVIAVGFLGYALGAFAEAFVGAGAHWDSLRRDLRDSDASDLIKSKHPGRWWRRGRYLGIGIGHLVLAGTAAGILTGMYRGAAQGEREWTAWALSYPFGGIAVGLTGCAVAAFGVSQVRRAWRPKIDSQLDVSSLGAAWRKAIHWVGRVGVSARGVVFALIGLFLLRAAWDRDPREARDMGESLRALQQRPYGPWLLGAVAAGLMAFGVFLLVQAKYRRMGGKG